MLTPALFNTQDIHNKDNKELAEFFGFRGGDRGTHTSRTLMLSELNHVLTAVSLESPREDYSRAIREENVLEKRTGATRVQSEQRLRELYGLDPKIPLFRILRQFWTIDEAGRPLLALLCALARDPLLRATTEPILALPAGTELSRQSLTEAIRRSTGQRLNDSILRKVARNAASSWTQSRHLQGRVLKKRQRISATPVATAYALLLGYLMGLRGQSLFQTLWTRTLDVSMAELISLAADAKRLGVLDLKHAGEVIEVSFPAILTPEEREMSRGTN